MATKAAAKKATAKKPAKKAAAKKAPAARRHPAKNSAKATPPARKAPAPIAGQQRVRVFRSTKDHKWYAERRAANGMLVKRTHGYAKRGRAVEYGRKLAEPAAFVIEEPLPL